jgi:hypothetical protein
MYRITYYESTEHMAGRRQEKLAREANSRHGYRARATRRKEYRSYMLESVEELLEQVAKSNRALPIKIRYIA